MVALGLAFFGGADADFLGGEGGRQILQYKGRGPNVSRLVLWSQPLQTKLNTREWISRLCALTVYSLTLIVLLVITYILYILIIS